MNRLTSKNQRGRQTGRQTDEGGRGGHHYSQKWISQWLDPEASHSLSYLATQFAYLSGLEGQNML